MHANDDEDELPINSLLWSCDVYISNDCSLLGNLLSMNDLEGVGLVHSGRATIRSSNAAPFCSDSAVEEDNNRLYNKKKRGGGNQEGGMK